MPPIKSSLKMLGTVTMNAETLFLIASVIILEIMFIAGERDGRNMWDEFERKKRRKKSMRKDG